MYRNLAGSGNGGSESVHLDDYPEVDRSKIDARLSAATRLAMRLSSLGRSARGKGGHQGPPAAGRSPVPPPLGGRG